MLFVKCIHALSCNFHLTNYHIYLANCHLANSILFSCKLYMLFSLANYHLANYMCFSLLQIVILQTVSLFFAALGLEICPCCSWCGCGLEELSLSLGSPQQLLLWRREWKFSFLAIFAHFKGFLSNHKCFLQITWGPRMVFLPLLTLVWRRLPSSLLWPLNPWKVPV